MRFFEPARVNAGLGSARAAAWRQERPMSFRDAPPISGLPEIGNF
jgi:hypothetical protein